MALHILDIMKYLVASNVLICSLWYRYNLSAVELHVADFDTISGLYFGIYLADIDFLHGSRRDVSTLAGSRVVLPLISCGL